MMSKIRQFYFEYFKRKLNLFRQLKRRQQSSKYHRHRRFSYSKQKQQQ